MHHELLDFLFLDDPHRCSHSGTAAGTHMGSPVYLEAVLHHTTLVVSCYDLATFVEGTGRSFLIFVDISEVFPTMKEVCMLHT